MGDWKMSKPDLRAGLEADLKLVCDGRKTKEEVTLIFKDRIFLIKLLSEVLDAQVARYKQVFQGTVEAVVRLSSFLD